MTNKARPEPGSCRADGLSGAARQVHLAVLAELAGTDALAFTADGEIRAAYPFSAAATPIRVSWPGGPAAYAMCAIDALGMSAMLGRPVTIIAAEPGTGRVITVHADGDHARWNPSTTVVFAGCAGDAGRPSADGACRYINFFATARNARAWARRHREVTGRLLTQDAALRSGVAQFGTLLQPAPPPGARATTSPE